MSDALPNAGLEGVFLENRDKLLRFLRARGAGDAAEDLVQDVWLQISAAAPGPVASPLAYFRLKEKGYADQGGGAGLDLVVDGRTSDELGVNAGLTLGIDFYGNRKGDENWLRLETEGGRREIVSGGLGDTTAQFKDGTPFTLHGDGSTSGWFGRLRMFGGMSGFTLGGELGAEQRHTDVALTLRGTMRIGF